MPCDIEPSVSSVSDLPQLMSRYQQADATAVQILIRELSPQLYRFFAGCMGSRTDAEDMLQDLWLKIHQARYTYRPGEPVLPWVYAIARCVRTDSYRKRSRIASREKAMAVVPEISQHRIAATPASFEELVAPLSDRQRIILTMLKVNGMSLEDVARATATTIGAVKQEAHRAYERLRSLRERASSEVHPAARP
jgi:RNA polymerase sigma-70 factor, ECF subfamily